MPYNTYPYELPPLPYAYDALEPYIDEQTMHYHHDKHFQTYVDNLNNALEPYPALQRLLLEQLLSGRCNLPRAARTAILHNAGGVYNHTLYFNGLAPAGTGRNTPNERLSMLIDNTLCSFDNFRELFTKNALSVFGSGWTFLTCDCRNRLCIINLKNQDTVVPYRVKPLVIFDVWEHAYYLKYKNLRADYVNGLWNIVNFPEL